MKKGIIERVIDGTFSAWSTKSLSEKYRIELFVGGNEKIRLNLSKDADNVKKYDNKNEGSSKNYLERSKA